MATTYQFKFETSQDLTSDQINYLETLLNRALQDLPSYTPDLEDLPELVEADVKLEKVDDV